MDTWPFKADFEWAALPSDPPPGSGVLPWRSLQELQERQDWPTLQGHLEGMPPEFGYHPISDQRVGRLPVPWDMVVEEYEAQSVLFEWAGQWYRLARAEEATASPLIDAVALVSLTRGDGTREDPSGLVVGAIEAHARWTDRMAVRRPAEVTQEPFVTVWAADRLQLVAAGEVLHEAPARLTRAVRPCPMIPDAPAGQLCRQYGGPWVSRAIVASGRWLDERCRRLADVGCDTCGDGALRVIRRDGDGFVLVGPIDRPQRADDGPTRFTHPVKLV